MYRMVRVLTAFVASSIMPAHRILFVCRSEHKLPFLYCVQSKPAKSYSIIMGENSQFELDFSIAVAFNVSILTIFRYHHSHESLENRQKQLLLQYKFRCQCEPCQKDYPKFSELEEANIPTILTETDIKRITNLDKDFARKNFSRFCTYLYKYGHHYPCSQISSVEECLKMCLLILVNNIPLKLQYK